MTGWSSAEPKLPDDTASILGDLQRAMTDDSKVARERIREEFTKLKQKVSQLEFERLEYIDRLENDKKAAITNIRTEHDGLKMAQQYAGKNNPEIVKKFREIENNLNRLRNSLRSQKINIETHGENISDVLQHFCTITYGAPPDNQGIPPPNVIPPNKPPQQTAEIPKPKFREKTGRSEALSKGLTLPGNPMDHFIRFVRNSKNVDKPTLESQISNEIMVEAKKYIEAKNKYSLVNYYEVVLNSLKDGKLINNVRIGIEHLTKLAFCIYMDKQNEETNIIKTDSAFYQEGVLKNISHIENIFRILGYEYKTQLWQINLAAANDPDYEAKVERMFCEMCVLIQELILIEQEIPGSAVTAHFTQLLSKSVVEHLPMPGASKIAAKTQSIEKNDENREIVKPKPIQSEDENEEQFVFSELIVAIDSLQTQDEKFDTSLAEANPEQFLELANKCVALPLKKKYQQIAMYEVIHTNVCSKRSIDSVRLGLVGAFKYAFCQYFKADLRQIAILLYEEEPFKSLVADRMLNSEQIFHKMGYQQLPGGKGMQLDQSISDKNHSQTIIHIICEILIGIQELTQFPTTGYDPIAYFETNRHFAPGDNIACPPVHERTVRTAEHAIEHAPLPNPTLSSTVPTFPLNQSQNSQPQFNASIGHVDARQSNTNHQLKPIPPRRPSDQALVTASNEHRQRQGSGKIQNITTQDIGQMPNQPPIGTAQSQFNPPTGAAHSQFNPPTGAAQSQSQFNPPTGAGQSQFNPPTGTAHSQFNPPTGTAQSQFNPPTGAGQSQFNPPTGTAQSQFNPPTGAGQSQSQYNPPTGAGQSQSQYNPPTSAAQSQYNPPGAGQSQSQYNPPTSAAQSQSQYNPPTGVGQSQYNPPGAGQAPNNPPTGTAQSQYNPPGAGLSQYNPPGAGQSQYNPPGAGQAPNNPPTGTAQSQYNPPGAGQSQYNPPPGAGQSQYNPPPGAGQSQYNPPAGAGQSQYSPPIGTGQPQNNPQNTGISQSVPPTGQLQALHGKHPAIILVISYKALSETSRDFKLKSPIPNNLVELAGACLPLSAKDKYSSNIICDVIIKSLYSQKTIPEIRTGLEWLAKFIICIYLKIVDLEVQIVKESGGIFGQEILTCLTLTQSVYSCLGYEYHSHSNCFYLKQETFLKEESVNRLVNLGCDCLIAVQDLSGYENIGSQKFIEFFQQYSENPVYDNIENPRTIQPLQQRQYADQESEKIIGKHQDVYSSHQPMKQSPEAPSSYHSNPQFSVPVHSQMPHADPHISNYPANPHRDQMARQHDPPSGQNVASQYRSGMSYQQNVDRQIGNQPQERRQISGQQQQQNEWQCPHCTSYNLIKYSYCSVCYKTPDFKSDIPEMMPTPSPQPTKLCSHCSQVNRMQDVHCVKCGNSMLQQN